MCACMCVQSPQGLSKASQSTGTFQNPLLRSFKFLRALLHSLSHWGFKRFLEALELKGPLGLQKAMGLYQALVLHGVS